MKYGLRIPSFALGPRTASLQEMGRYLRRAEDLGFEAAVSIDHLLLTPPAYACTWLEPIATLSALAGVTRTIRLGTMVLVLPLRNPVYFAKEWATLDVLSGGRSILGIGVGWHEEEFALMNVPYKERGPRTNEAIELVQALWAGDRVTYEGRFYTVRDLTIDPKPVQRPHPPIWVGCARSEDSFRWAGKNGFHLMTLPYLYREPHVLPGLVKTYRSTLAEAGHDFTETEVLGKFHIYVSSSLDQAVREAEPYLINYFDVHHAADPERKDMGLMTVRDAKTQLIQGFVIAGDPQRCIDTIHRWREEVGLTTISGTFYFGGMPQEMALKNIRLFADRVIPEFK